MSYEYDEQMDREYEATHTRYRVLYKVTYTHHIDIDIPIVSDPDDVYNEISTQLEKIEPKDFFKLSEKTEFEDDEIVEYHED